MTPCIMRSVLIAAAFATIHTPHPIDEQTAMDEINQVQKEQKDMIGGKVDPYPHYDSIQDYEKHIEEESNVEKDNLKLKDIKAHPYHGRDSEPATVTPGSLIQVKDPESSIAAADWERAREAKTKFKEEFDQAAGIKDGEDDGLDLDDGEMGSTTDDSDKDSDDGDSSFLQTKDKSKGKAKSKDPEPKLPSFSAQTGTDYDQILSDDNDQIAEASDDIADLEKKAEANRIQGLGSEDPDDLEPLKATSDVIDENGRANLDGGDADDDDSAGGDDSSLVQTKARVSVDAHGRAHESLRKE